MLVLTSMFPRWRDDTEPGFVFELCRRLAARFDVRVLAPHAPGAATDELMDGVEVVRYRYAPQRLETLAYGGGIVPKLRKRPLKWLLVPLLLVAQYRAIRRELRRWRPAVVHAHWIVPQGILAALSIGRGKRAALAITSHGTDLFAFNSAPMRRIKRRVLNKAAVVTVVSEALREAAAGLGVDTDKIHVAPMGVDLQSRFTPDRRIERSASELLFVGRLAPSKGLNVLLDAMPGILASRPDVSLTIAGFGPEESALRAQATRLGVAEKVAFIGAIQQSALPDLYRRAAVFIAPYVRTTSGEQEGFGLTIVEAIGCGCPVVATDMPGLRDIFGAHAGHMVEPGSANALAAVVMRLLDDPVVARQRAEEQRRRIVAKFDWIVVTERYADWIGHVIST
ncbi:MAG: glycosyltransferase [Xanthomonadaceae bacterium]|nr:glycosyltransferase [Xanthomonadaceae bacterium]